MTRITLWFWRSLVSRYWRIFASSFVIGILLVLLSIQLYPALSTFLADRRHTIIGLVGSYTPSTLPQPVQNLISIGLVGLSSSGEPVVGAAKAWEWGDAGKKLTFHLKENIRWHDGTQLVASDINYQLRDVIITPTDDKTIEIILKEPFAPLPVLFAKPLFKKGLVGIGSYQVSAIKLRGDRVSSLVLNPIDPESQTFAPLTIKFYPTEDAATIAFKRGEVTTLDELFEVDEFRSWPTVSIKENVKYNRYVGLFFNMQDSLVNEKNIRQALSLALEKPKDGGLLTPLSSKSWAYSNKVKTYDIDLSASQKLLDKEITGTESAELILSTVPAYVDLAERIAESWRKLKHLSVKIKVENSIPSEFQVLLASQEIPPDPDQYPFWHSTQTQTNITRLTNVKIDKLLEDARKELDPGKRKIMYADFQKTLLEDPPAIFLFHPTVYTLTRE